MTVKFFNRNIPFVLICTIGAILLRLFSFFPSELDHDESTYSIIANEIVNGKLLYTDVTDTKPVGIFLIYAAWQLLFGYSIVMKRLMAAIIVGLTAYLLSKVTMRLFNDKKAAVASAVVYIFYTSMWVYFGLSPNTELYFNFFSIATLALLLNGGTKNYLAAGFLSGIGFIIKYMVLFDFAAFMLFFFITELRRNGFRLKMRLLLPYFLASVGFLVPFVATALYFYFQGRFDDFYFVSFELPSLYKGNPSVWPFLKMLGDLLLRFFPISFFFLYTVFGKEKLLDSNSKILFGLWIALVLLAMYMPGKGFSHYAIELMLPLSILAGLFFNSKVVLKGWLSFFFRGKSGVIALVVVVLILQVASFVENVAKPDTFKQVATYLQKNTTPNDLVFVSNYEPIIYYLMHRQSPTKYVHSTLLFTDLHKAFKVDNIAEIQRIVDQKPKYILVQRKNELMEEMMGTKYVLDTTFRKGEIKVFIKTEIN